VQVTRPDVVPGECSEAPHWAGTCGHPLHAGGPTRHQNSSWSTEINCLCCIYLENKILGLKYKWVCVPINDLQIQGQKEESITQLFRIFLHCRSYKTLLNEEFWTFEHLPIISMLLYFASVSILNPYAKYVCISFQTVHMFKPRTKTSVNMRIYTKYTIIMSLQFW